MTKVTKLHKTLRGKIEKLPARSRTKIENDPYLKDLLRSIEGEKSSVPISSVTPELVEEIFGVKLWSFKMSAPNFGINWHPTIEPLTPSLFFEKHLKRVENHYDAESEPLTRALLDVYILEVMEHLSQNQAEPLRIFGEMALEASSDRITLSGFGDWLMAYGERNANVANVSLVGEAKNAGYPLGNSAVFQM
ncbi:hypothetical protein HDU88_008281 [Geranomyces variabilis]|nr:hypothetical protein HDU88_008281 [Geranomyces variabilis]